MLSVLINDLFSKLKNKKMRMAIAESCTGGMIAAAVTDVAGASEFLDRGFITYSNQAKMDLLGVYASTLEAHGAVSEQCAKAMAEGALRQSQADIASSVTGIAGPSGGTDEKPVGLVYIAIAQKNLETKVYRHLFSGTRDGIRKSARDQTLNHLIENL